MRQVMPHRNNIVAGRRCCKSFLYPTDSCSPNSVDCGIPVRTPSRRSKSKKMYYNNVIERYSEDQWAYNYHQLG
jgi:hypothetical protein